MSEEEIVDTGLVAATVTMPEPEPVADPVIAQAASALVTPSTQMPADWTLHKTAAFVSDMAHNLYDAPYILKKHNLTHEQFAILSENEFYKRALEAEVIAWNSANSIQKRLALESAIAVETALPTVAARLSKNTEPLGEVVALLKVLSEIAGTTGAKAQVQQPGSGDKFKIIINLGADVVTREATASVVAVQPQPEGQGAGPSLSSLVQASGSQLSILPKP